MKTEGEYTCEICGELFETNVEIAAHTIGHQKSVSKDEVLCAIQRLADEKGRAPTRNEMDDEGEYSTFPAVKLFGSWNQAIKAAGLEPNIKFDVSKDAVIDEVVRLAETKNRTPTMKDMRDDGSVSPSTVQRRFGSWSEALKMAGFTPTVQFDISQTDLLESFQQLAAKLGRTPTASEMEDLGAYSVKVFQRRFGSWNEAVRVAGHEPNAIHNIPEPELLAEIDRLADELGHPPSSNEMIEHGEYSITPYSTHFDDWESAITAAGHESRGQPSGPDHPSWKGGYPDRYGANWYLQRKRALERDNHTCQAYGCEITNESHQEKFSRAINVHHLIPLRTYSTGGDTVDYEQVNDLKNLITLCHRHHIKWERIAPLRPDTRHLDSI